MTTEPGTTIQVARTVVATSAEGPGVRFAVWVQGCTIRCDGCFNPHLWSTRGGHEMTPEDLARQALSSDVEGVTLLGGEPFEQAERLGEFAAIVRAGGLSVMTFTGFEREDLEAAGGPAGAESLLSETDLLVDGPYRADQRDFSRPWVGSTNQRFHFLTDSYAELGSTLDVVPDRLEIRVGPAGDVSVNGWAGVEDLDALLADEGHITGRGRVR